MLSVDVLSRLTKELILGLTPTNTSQEAADARREIAEDLEKMRKDGIQPDLPSDFDFDIPDLPPPPPPPTDAEMVESQKRVIRANLGLSWASQYWLIKDDEDEAQCCASFFARIEAVPLMSEPDRRQLLAEVVDCEVGGELQPWSAERVRQRLDRAVRRSLEPPKKRRKKKRRP